MAFNFGIPGASCKISYATTSNGSFTDIGQVKSFDFPGNEMVMWDSSGINSTTGEQIPVFFKAGDFSFTLIYDPGNAAAADLWAKMKAKTVLYWKVTFGSPVGPGATAPGSPILATFAGYVAAFPISGGDSENALEVPVKVGITGDVTIAAAS